MRHGADSCPVVRVQPDAHRRADRCTQRRRFINMRAFGRQTEDVSGDLHGNITLRAATGHAQAMDRLSRTAFDPLSTMPQGIGQTLQYGPVQMRAGVYVTETNDGPAGFGPWLANARAPVRLQHQAVATGGDIADLIIKHGLGGQAGGGRQRTFGSTEFLFEPGHHPESAEDLDLGVEMPWHGGRIGWQITDHLVVTR